MVPQRQLNLKSEEELLSGRKIHHAHEREDLLSAIDSLTPNAASVHVYADIDEAQDTDLAPLAVSSLVKMLYGDVGCPAVVWSECATKLRAKGFRLEEITSGRSGRTRTVLDIVLVTTPVSRSRSVGVPTMLSCTADVSTGSKERKTAKQNVQHKAWKVTMKHWPKDVKTGLYATMEPKSSFAMRAPDWAINLCEKVHKAAIRYYAAEEGIDPAPILQEFSYHDFRRNIQSYVDLVHLLSKSAWKVCVVIFILIPHYCYADGLMEFFNMRRRR